MQFSMQSTALTARSMRRDAVAIMPAVMPQHGSDHCTSDAQPTAGALAFCLAGVGASRDGTLDAYCTPGPRPAPADPARPRRGSAATAIAMPY